MTTKPKLFITGGHGMLGSRFIELHGAQYDLSAPSADELSLLDHDAVCNRVADFQPNTIIHFAAITDVSKAETERNNEQGSCWQVNVAGTQNVVDAATQMQSTVVYISTDYVFDGAKGPYTENDAPMSTVEQGTWYGWTKLLGEKIVQKALVPSMVVRVASPFLSHYAKKLDFVRSMYKKMQEGTLPPLFTDQQISPTFVDDIADALHILITTNSQGIYHVTGSSQVSPYEVAIELAKTFELDPSSIKQGTLVDFLETKKDEPYAAVRYPKNSALDNTKIQALLLQHGKKMHTLVESFASMKAQGIRVQ